MDYKTAKDRIEAAETLIDASSTSKEKIESLASLLHGLNPTLDRVLGDTTKAFDALDKLQQGDVIELAAEHVPAKSEKEKKRKKALLLFLKHWKELKEEVDRVQAELDGQNQTQSRSEQLRSFGRIAAAAKGPLGLITIAAIAGIVLLPRVFKENPASPTSTAPASTVTPATIKVILINGKQIPLTNLTTGQGTECSDNALHYHALDHTAAKALDGSMVPDPGGCGFGRVSEVQVIEVNL